MLNGEIRWSLAPSIAWQRVGDGVVLVDVATGVSKGLNESGSFLFARLEGRSSAELAEDLAQHYSIEIDRAHRDVAVFIEALAVAGALVPENGPR